MAYIDQSIGEFLALVGEPTPAPGGGAVAAMSAAMAASLTAMTRPETADEVSALGRRAAALADEDADAYSAVIAARRAGTSTADALTRATMVPLEIAATAAAISEHAAKALLNGRHDVRGDAATALLLAEGATRSAAFLVEINVGDGGATPDLIRLAHSHIATVLAARELAHGRAPAPAED
jgi:formiminotetrahydrofolate cyclodeaminase